MNYERLAKIFAMGVSNYSGPKCMLAVLHSPFPLNYRWNFHLSITTEFPIAYLKITTNLATQNTTNLLLYSSKSQNSKVSLRKLKSRYWQGCLPSGGSHRESISLPFPDSRGHLLSWLLASHPSDLCSAIV